MIAGALPLRDLRRLAASAATADDAALLRLVKLLDSLPERGEADRVLDPSRPRLQALKPKRPMRFARLLFLPLDGAIVPAQRWRRGSHEIPRTAIPPLAAAVEQALGPAAAAIRRDAEGRDMADRGAVAALGAQLWPAASAVLPAAPPAGWGSTALTREDYAAIRDILGPVLASGVAILCALHAAGRGPPEELVRHALAEPAEAGPLPLAAALATLLRRATEPGQVLLTAGEIGPAARAVASRMTDCALAMLPDPAAVELEVIAGEARRFFGAADNLAESGLLDPERTRRLLAQRHAAEEACRRRVADAGSAQVIGPLVALQAAGAIEDASLAMVERDARSIRALADVGRSAGDPTPYDRALRQIVESAAALGDRPDGLQPIDLARIVEILAGPDAAEALLRRLPRG